MSLEGKNNVLPPYSNTGAQNTYQGGLIALVDWVQATFKNVQDVHEIILLLGLKKEDFREMQTGNYGYKSQLRFGSIALYYNGRSGMGIHLEMTGQGCREYESMNIFTWSRLFALFTLYDVSFSRLDIAIDDFEGYFKIKTLKRKIRDKALRTKFHRGRGIEDYNFRAKENESAVGGETVYFGSGQSKIQIRFYDKLEQMKSKGRTIEEGLEFWNRTEVQMRDKRADMCALLLMNEKCTIGECVSGILKNYITFCEKSADSNKARWKTSKFWSDFLGDVEPLQLTQVAPDRTIERVEMWHQKQVDGSIALLYLAYEQDLSMMFNKINEGMDKLKDNHISMLNRYLIENNKPTIDITHFEEIIENKKIDIQSLKKKLNA